MAPFPDAVISQIKEALDNGEKSRDIASRLSIPYYRVQALKRQWKDTGEVREGPEKPKGRPGKLRSPEELAQLREFLDRYPFALIKDITDFLALQCGIDVDTSTVYRTLARQGWLQKRTPIRERDTLGMWKPTLPRDENGKVWYGPAKDIGRVKRKRDPNGPSRKEAVKNEKLFSRVEAFVKSFMSHPIFDASHDFAHVLRVANLAKHILKAERNANPSVHFETMVVQLAALLHDIDDHKYKQVCNQTSAAQNSSTPARPIPENTSVMTGETPSHPPYGHTSSQPTAEVSHETGSLPDRESESPSQQNQPSSPTTPPPADASQVIPTSPYELHERIIKTHLSRLRVPNRLIPAIATVCTAISYTTEIAQPEHIAAVQAAHPELAIVQDADRLDALGAIGLGRAFTYGAMKVPERGMEGTLAHVDDKLLKLESMMKTAEGKRLARIRTDRIKAFRGWWQDEMSSGMDQDAQTNAGSSALQGGRFVWHTDADPDPTTFAENINGVNSTPNTQNINGLGLNGDNQSAGASTVDNPNRQLMMEAGMLR